MTKKARKKKGGCRGRVRMTTVYPAVLAENNEKLEGLYWELQEVLGQVGEAKSGLQSLGLPQIVIDEVEDKFLELEQKIEELADVGDYGYPVKVPRGVETMLYTVNGRVFTKIAAAKKEMRSSREPIMQVRVTKNGKWESFGAIKTNDKAKRRARK